MDDLLAMGIITNDWDVMMARHYPPLDHAFNLHSTLKETGEADAEWWQEWA